jgi:hypothetical protein
MLEHIMQAKSSKEVMDARKKELDDDMRGAMDFGAGGINNSSIRDEFEAASQYSERLSEIMRVKADGPR